MFDVPLALVTLDADHDAGRADHPLGAHPWFCETVLTSPDMVVVPDTASDPSWRAARLPDAAGTIRFYAGLPLVRDTGSRFGTLCLMDTRPRALGPAEQDSLRDMARIATSVLRERFDASAIRHLAIDVSSPVRGMHDHYASAQRYKTLYDRCSTMAGIGVWECDLATEELTWTDGVYDIFELPRGSAVTRRFATGFYDKASLIEMERRRRRAIAECGSFTLDIRIRTAKGNRRWVRLSGDVEGDNGVATRIFGLKQDITRERQLWDRLQMLAECDPLTGLANRGVFEAHLARSLQGGGGAGALGALILIDLDGFKAVNDTFGHAAGDDCLKEVAARLRRGFRRAQLIARVGGDEFAVLLGRGRDRAKIDERVQRVIEEIRRPMEWHGQAFEVGASMGIVMRYERPDCSPSQLYADADCALYAAKTSGRNTVRTFDLGLDRRRVPRGSSAAIPMVADRPAKAAIASL